MVKSSKLSTREYFRFVEKNRLSLIIISLSFSKSREPLKKASLEARNGLNVSLVFVKNFFPAFLS